ncbi:PQQ-binding-like beta-propeller repeat protein [Streptomyces sp. DG2A-72]|uniref:PQQ-binding-like beta-propeller repeat protein n=1 Tax=Streptomyces sp. DG2A-72 TaxID=3051386 RepID=UPI00265BEBA4|nr:PQQ-binding-like beta-propeller repeat protein [Streptomyces sp. DG2A-72]MDO0933617.1 PQQ-binding-like beta-propeller repeat protein [Streptomyces sp. DG2A-72]
MSDASPLHDYSRSRAVLIGVSEYDHLPPARPAATSLKRMAGLLTGPLCDWPKERVQVWEKDKVRRSDRLPDQLMEAFDGVKDIALFYFVGHGQLYDDELCLALRESPRYGPRCKTIGLPFSDVREALRACDAQTKIVILDCCFAGIVHEHSLAPESANVIDWTHAKGAVTLAASGKYRTAWYEPGSGTHKQTYFTKYLIDAVEQGIPGRPEGLPLGAIYDQAAHALAIDKRPEPTRSIRHDADRFILARNRAHPAVSAAPFTGTSPGTAQTPEPGPEPTAGAPTSAGRISRRTALRLGMGAAAVGAGIPAARALFDHNTPDPRLRWRYTTGEAVISSPTVVDGVVYIGSDDNNVYALDAATGSKQWAYATGNRVAAAPTVVDGVVYAGGLDNSVYALDAGTGKRKWAYATGDWIKEAPTVVDGVVYIGGYRKVFALDAVTGNEEWAYVSNDTSYSSPTVVDGVVYVGSSTDVYALDAATGKKKWQYGTVELIRPWPTAVDGVVYIGSGRYDPNIGSTSAGSVFALDAATGNKKWGYQADYVFQMPTVVDGVLYIGSYNSNAGSNMPPGSVVALDAATGDRKWQFQTDRVYGSPAVGDGAVYIGTFGNSVYALDAATGNEKWAYATGDKVQSSPAVVDGVVYIGSFDNSVYALNATIGDSSAQPS